MTIMFFTTTTTTTMTTINTKQNMTIQNAFQFAFCICFYFLFVRFVLPSQFFASTVLNVCAFVAFGVEVMVSPALVLLSLAVFATLVQHFYDQVPQWLLIFSEQIMEYFINPIMTVCNYGLEVTVTLGHVIGNFSICHFQWMSEIGLPALLKTIQLLFLLLWNSVLPVDFGVSVVLNSVIVAINNVARLLFSRTSTDCECHPGSELDGAPADTHHDQVFENSSNFVHSPANSEPKGGGPPQNCIERVRTETPLVDDTFGEKMNSVSCADHSLPKVPVNESYSECASNFVPEARSAGPGRRRLEPFSPWRKQTGFWGTPGVHKNTVRANQNGEALFDGRHREAAHSPLTPSQWAKQYKANGQQFFAIEQIQTDNVESYQGRVDDVTVNGCAVIASLVCYYHLTRGREQWGISQVIEDDAPPILKELRESNGLKNGEKLITEDVNKHFTSHGWLSYAGAFGGNILCDEHVAAFVDALADPSRRRAASLVLREHVVAVLRVDHGDGSFSYSIVDSLPFDPQNGKGASCFDCKDETALKVFLHAYGSSKLTSQELLDIDRHEFHEHNVDDPRYFQAVLFEIPKHPR